MELSSKQQAIDLIKKSQKILLVGNNNPTGDTVGSLVAFGEVLERLGKEVSIVSESEIPENLGFLPYLGKIKTELEGSKDFIIKIDAKENPVEKLYYDVEEGFLNIVVTPEKGTYAPENVSFGKGSYKYDLIIVLDTPDVDKIDKIYDENTDLFFETPVVNIDHHVGNEHFGTVNFIDITATSTAEILVSLVEALGSKLDEDISTLLLTGIISDTGSFKKKNTTPKSLTVSAQLLAAGAKQQEIINNLYKAKTINTLKLWGKVLSRLDYDAEHRFIYSYIDHDDFKELGTKDDDIEEVMEDLMNNAPGADVVLLLTEVSPNKINGRLHGQRGTDVLTVAEIFGGKGEFHTAEFSIDNMTMEKAVSEAVGKIRQMRGKKLGLEKPDENKRVIVPLQKIEKGEEADQSGTAKEAEKSVVSEIEKALEEENSDNPKDISKESEKEAVEKEEEGSVDIIAEAIQSLEMEKQAREEEEKKKIVPEKKENENSKGLSSIKDVLKNKFSKEKKTLGKEIFQDENDEEIMESSGEMVNEDTDEGGIRVWRPDN